MNRRFFHQARKGGSVARIALSILILPVFFFLMGLHTALAQTSSVDGTQWVPNGQVRTMAVGSDGTLYLGGSFTMIGPYTGYAVPIDATSGLALTTFPKVAGAVDAVIPDGSGGWYVGGNFTQVGGVTRNYIAHIRTDGTLDSSWNPNADDTVLSMAISGNTLYAGGGFKSLFRIFSAIIPEKQV